MRTSLKLLAGVGILSLAGAAQAYVDPYYSYPYSVELTNHTSSNTQFPGDTRSGGNTSEVAFVNDGDQVLSTRLEINNGLANSNSKVGPYFHSEAVYNPTAPVAIGHIGNLGSFTLDWYRETPDLAGTEPTAAAWYIPAVRIYMAIDAPASPTGELIWENAYNAYEANVPNDTWVNNYDIVDHAGAIGGTPGRFYLRADPDGPGGVGRQNFGDSSGFTLAQWLAPASDPTSVRALQPTWPTISYNNFVFGVTTSVGSGAPDGVGYIDDVTLTFIPEPASVGLLSLGGLLALRRRRQA
jgi:hypothetical protein